MPEVLRRFNAQKIIYLAVFLTLVLQPFLAVPAQALEDTALIAISPPPPTHGSPHSEVKRDTNFAFSWAQPAIESTLQYQLRIATDESQVGEASDSSEAWYSPYFPGTSIPAANVPILGNGQWYWQARAIDEAGNKGSWSNVWTVAIDTQGPTIHVAQPLGDALIGNATVSFDATVSDVSELGAVTVELDGQDVTSLTQQTRSEAMAKLHKDYQPGEIPDGVHIVRVIAEDMYGQSSGVTRSFTVDSTPPLISTKIEESQLLKGVVSLDLMANELGTYAIRITDPKGGLLAQHETELQTEKVLTHMYTWHTWEVANGEYTITLTGRDRAGNESTITRHVTVGNVVEGVAIANDPLLDELSVALSQPLVAPYVSSLPGVLAGSPPVVSDAPHSHDALLTAVPEFTPVVATENGWRLFGILWYWWMLAGLLLASGLVFAWRSVRAPLQQIPDSV